MYTFTLLSSTWVGKGRYSLELLIWFFYSSRKQLLAQNFPQRNEEKLLQADLVNEKIAVLSYYCNILLKKWLGPCLCRNEVPQSDTTLTFCCNAV